MAQTELRLLVVTESVPFPPRNGRELPTSHLIRGFAERFRVDLLVASEGEAPDFERRRARVPEAVARVTRLGVGRTSAVRRAAGEVLGLRPSYFARGFDSAALERVASPGYDFVWVSPVGLLGLVQTCRRLGLLSGARIGLGLNDVKATLYADSVRASLVGRGSLSALLRGPRLIGLRAAERRYLRECDLVHLQTAKEVERARALLGPGPRPVLVQAQNGRKDELFSVEPAGIESNDILYMTHLSGGRARESTWFLRRVWPRLRARHPRATLHLVGSPPLDLHAASERLGERVVIHGFVDDLVALYRKVRVAVVPILHSTGLINRIVDAMTAGVPVVSTPGPLATVDGSIPGRHALCTESVDDFEAAVSRLLTDPDRWTEISSAGRALARTQPTWSQTTERLAQAVEACTGSTVGPGVT